MCTHLHTLLRAAQKAAGPKGLHAGTAATEHPGSGLGLREEQLRLWSHLQTLRVPFSREAVSPHRSLFTVEEQGRWAWQPTELPAPSPEVCVPAGHLTALNSNPGSRSASPLTGLVLRGWGRGCFWKSKLEPALGFRLRKCLFPVLCPPLLEPAQIDAGVCSCALTPRSCICPQLGLRLPPSGGEERAGEQMNPRACSFSARKQVSPHLQPSHPFMGEPGLESCPLVPGGGLPGPWPTDAE